MLGALPSRLRIRPQGLGFRVEGFRVSGFQGLGLGSWYALRI